LAQKSSEEGEGGEEVKYDSLPLNFMVAFFSGRSVIPIDMFTLALLEYLQIAAKN
jgi:hypothetical protein